MVEKRATHQGKEGTAKKPAIEFYAITENARVEGRKTIRERVPAMLPLDQQLAENLATLFRSMADTFFEENPTVVEFDGRYTPGKGEMFVIEDFKLDQAILTAVKNPLAARAELNLSRSPFPQIKAIILTEVNSPLRVIFQEFKTDQIIRQGWAFLQRTLHNKFTFDKIDTSGIAIGNDVDAVYDDGKLYFRSYYSANRFADLTAYFKDATDEEIKELLKMDGIVAEDEETLLKQTDAAMRRKFAIIKKTEILNLVTPEQIAVAGTAQGLAIDFQLGADKRKQIVIPAEKAAAKELLDFLCQARFVGPLTNELFIANSFRPISSKRDSDAKPPTETRATSAPVKKSTKKVAKKKVAKRS